MASLEDLSQDGMDCIHSILAFPKLHETARDALRRLSSNPPMRNAVMGLPADFSPPVSLNTVLSFHLTLTGTQPVSQEYIFENPPHHLDGAPTKKPRLAANQARNTARATRKKVILELFTDPGLLRHLSIVVPAITTGGLLSRDGFLLALVGEKTVEEGLHGITMKTILHRLEKIEEYIRHTRRQGKKVDFRSTVKLGRAWIPPDDTGVLLALEESWQDYFCGKVCQGGFLDVLAGVEVPGIDGNDRKNDGYGSCAKGVILGGAKGRISQRPAGGAVVEWSRNCFSPQFREYFEKDCLPSIGFMLDPTSPGSGRYIGCESSKASFNAPPVYFQMGKVPSASLFRAVGSSKFGDIVLQIANFVETERYNYFHSSLTNLFGEQRASEMTPPKKLYDLLFVVLGSRSFSYHTDSRFMLYDNEKPGWEEAFLRVVTLFFQNMVADNLVELRFRGKGSSKPSDVVKLPLGASGIHEQGNYTQLHFEHCPHEAPNRPLGFRRCAWTARATGPLQDSGLEALKDCQAKIPIYGQNLQDYKISGHDIYFNLGGGKECGPSEEHPTMFGEEGEDNTVMAGQKGSKAVVPPPTVPVFLPPSQQRDKREMCMPQYPNLKDRSIFSRRPGHFPFYPPRAQSKLLRIRRSIIHIISSGEAQALLYGRRIMFKIQEGKACIPFGPFPHHSPDGRVHEKFAAIGTYYPTEIACGYYHLPSSATNSRAWNTKLHRLNVLHLSKRYKSSIESPECPRSPAADLFNIENKKPRKGFYVYFSGGNGMAGSSHGPVGSEPVVQEAGIAYECPVDMDLHSPQNEPLYKAVKAKRIITVFLSQQNLPPNMRRNESGVPYCFHAGMYQLKGFESCEAKSPANVKHIVERAKLVTGLVPHGLEAIQLQYLSFLRYSHYRCWLEPIEECHSHSSSIDCRDINNWETLQIPWPPVENLCVSVPLDFGASDLAMSPHISPATSSLLRSFLPCYSSSKSLELGAEEGNEPEDKDPYKVLAAIPVPFSFSADSMFDTWKRLIIAHAMRVLHINVDDNQCVGCLCDPPKQFPGMHAQEGETITCSRYSDHFGSGSIKFCGSLGANVQEHAYPCPLPAGDAKVVYLQECNTSPELSYEQARLKRPGLNFVRDNPALAKALLIQSFLTETTGNPSTNRVWWQEYSKQQGYDNVAPQLPMDEDSCLHYLQFMEATSYHQRKDGSLVDFLHGQYQVDAVFTNYRTFRPALLNFLKNVDRFIADIVLGDTTRLDRPKIVEGLAHFLVDNAQCAGSTFHASKILANMEELISGCPFGEVTGIPAGVGSTLGCQLVDWGSLGDGSQPATIDECYQRIREHLQQTCCERSDWWYGYLRRDDNLSILQNCINGREINDVDIEHFLCKLYIYREYEPSGGRGVPVTNPSYQQRHCFPMKGVEVNGLERVASKALNEFKMEYLRQGVHYCSFTESMETMAKESLELFSRHFSCPIFASAFPTEEKEEDITRLPKPKMTVFGEFIDRTECCKMHLAAWSSRGRRVVYYDELEGSMTGKRTKLPMVQVAEELQEVVQSAVLQTGLNAIHNFTKTFTLLSQCPDQSDKCHSAYYQEGDQIYQNGKVFIFPIEGVWYHLVATTDCALERKDDSSREFNIWKGALPAREQQAIEGFIADFSSVARKRQHTQLHIFQLKPGTALALQDTNFTQGAVVPRQTDGVVRKLLLFRSLQA